MCLLHVVYPQCSFADCDLESVVAGKSHTHE